MPIFDYLCINGHIEEHITKDPYHVFKCSICNELAVYKPTMPHIGQMKMGIDPQGCPTAADKWAKAHEKGAEQH